MNLDTVFRVDLIEIYLFSIITRLAEQLLGRELKILHDTGFEVVDFLNKQKSKYVTFTWKSAVGLVFWTRER